MAREMAIVKEPQEIARSRFGRSRNLARRFQVGNRFIRVERRALESGGQERSVPMVWTDLRDTPWIGDGDERGQVLVLGAERVAHPGSGARKTLEGKPGAHLIL